MAGSVHTLADSDAPLAVAAQTCKFGPSVIPMRGAPLRELTYLTVINGYSKMLIANLKVGDPLRDILEEIDKAGERAGGLPRQLLAFSRTQILAPRRFDVNRGIKADELLPVALLAQFTPAE
jgi:hypothetical protein